MSQSGHLLPFPHAPDGIELRHLRAFVAVAEELNFGRAAERLYVSQPALSRQIRGLEHLVGCELLRRSTHRVELTLAGAALLSRARKVLSDVDEAVSATLAVGGELLARSARSLAPLAGLVTHDVDLHAARAAFEELHAQFEVPPGTCVRPATAGGIPALLVSPGHDLPATVMYLHGGGYVLGSAFGYQPHAGALATAAQAGVLVPDYRLAPEHPFPAALQDALRAYQWMTSRGTSARTVTIAADSAGCGLALALLLTLKLEQVPLPGAAVLFCPWVNLAARPGPHPARAAAPLTTTDEAELCASAYLAGRLPDDPVLNPLAADLSGLPPMLIQAATGDARLAEARALAARARDHGVDTRLELYPVDAHAFQLFWSFLPEASDAIEAAGAFIRQIQATGQAPASRPARRQDR